MPTRNSRGSERPWLAYVLRSALAGALIGLGCIACVRASDPTVGSLLFSVGLLSVLFCEAHLFTGLIGFVDRESWAKTAVSLVVNLTAIALMALCVPTTEKCVALASAKAAKPWWDFLLDAVWCGMIIYLSVYGYRKTSSPLVPILGVMVFVLSGFEHCVADMFYFVSARETAGLWLVPIAAAGNAVGSLAVHWAIKGAEKVDGTNKEKAKRIRKQNGLRETQT